MSSYREFAKHYKGVSVATIINEHPDLVKLADRLHKKPTWQFLVSALYEQQQSQMRQQKLESRTIAEKIRDLEQTVKSNMFFSPSADFYKSIDNMNDEEKVTYYEALQDANAKDDAVINNYLSLWGFSSLEEMHEFALDFLNADGNPADTISDDFLRDVANQFEKLCGNTGLDAHILFRVYDISGNAWYFRLNDNNMEFVKQLIMNRGNYSKILEYMTGSDIDWLGEDFQMASLEIIDIDQLPEEQRRYHIKKNSGGCFPFLLNTEKHSLSRYMIYNLVETATPDNCFIHALKMSGMLTPLQLANIRHDIGSIAFIPTAAIKFIAEKYDIHITLIPVYEKNRGRMQHYGNQEKPSIPLALYLNHYFLHERIQFNVLYFKYRSYPECTGVSDDRMWYTNGFNRSGPRFFDSIPVKDTIQLIRDLFKYPDALVPITRDNAPKVMRDEQLLFDFDETNYRRYFSDSDNRISKFYNTIPNLYQIGGNLEDIVRSCAYGGRVLLSKPKLHVKEKLADLDVNALYPYAESLLFLQTGLPRHLPETMTIDDILHHAFDDGQIAATPEKFISSAHLRIRITSIGKQRKYPVINNLDLGVYSVDLIILQELVKWHSITADVIGGFIWCGDRDYSIRDFVLKLYEQRKEDETVKYMMNKMTGYTLKRNDVNKRDEIHNSETLWKTMIEDYYSFNKAEPLANKNSWGVSTVKRWTDTYNLAHFGVSILSMSKRIMNTILYTCEDNDIDVFYSDTDSIFIRYSDVDKLNSLFSYRLIGDKLGQMKVDFDYGYPYATEAIFLGKKRYICKLDNGDYHYRYIGKNKKDIAEPWNFYMSQL